MVPTCFGLRPSSGSLQLSLAKIILIVCCVLCAVLCTTHNTHAILGHADTPPHKKLRRNLTECFNVDIAFARLICKLPDDCRRPKHVGAT